jgi:hypothetical protein
MRSDTLIRTRVDHVKNQQRWRFAHVFKSVVSATEQLRTAQLRDESRTAINEQIAAGDFRFELAQAMTPSTWRLNNAPE